MLNHTHLLISASSDEDKALTPYKSSFKIIAKVYKNTFQLQKGKFPPIDIVPKPVIYLLKRNK